MTGLHLESDSFYFFVFEQSGERVDEFRASERKFLHKRIVRDFYRERSSMESRNLCNGSEGFADRLPPRLFELLKIFVAMQLALHD